MTSLQPELPLGSEEQDKYDYSSLLDQEIELEDNIDAYRYEYAPSIERQRENARQRKINRELLNAYRRADPYSELGGNRPKEPNPLDQLDDYIDEDGFDFVDVYERLDITNSLDEKQYARMTKEDKIRLALHMENRVKTLRVRAGLIGADGGYEDPHFQSYQFTSQADAEEYSRNLSSFARTIIKTDGYRSMQATLKEEYGNDWRKAKSLRAEYKNHPSNLYIINDTKLNKLRVHYEPTMRYSA